MIRSTTIKANDRTLRAIERMRAMKDEHRKNIIDKIKQTKEK